MEKSMIDVKVGTAAGITTGIVASITAGIPTITTGLLAGEYFFHIALDASTNKPALLKPAPGTEKEEKIPGEERNVPETAVVLKAQYEEREVASSDQLKLYGYLCRQKKPDKKWIVLIYGYDGSGMWFRREALAFYQAGFNLLLPDVGGHGKSWGIYVGMGRHDRPGVKERICWFVRQYSDSEIVLYGVSVGAAAVTAVAGEKLPSNIEATMEDCDYASAWSVLSYQIRSQFYLFAFPFLYYADFVTRIEAGYGMKGVDVSKCVTGTRLLMFFVHGTKDRSVPFEMVEEFYDACRGERECLAVASVAHAQTALVGGVEYWGQMLRSVGGYLER